MATNPYSYGSLGSRWTVGEPTSKSLLDISRVKNDANRWTLEQLIPDPDTTQTLGFDLSFSSSSQRLLQIYNASASNYFQIFGGRAASSTSDYLVFSTGTNGTIMEFDGANHWITFHDTAGVQKMYYRGDGSPGLILESGVDLTVGGTGTFSDDVSIDGDTLFVDASADRVGINTASPSESLTNRGNVFIETNSTSADSGNGLFWQSTTSGWSTSSAHAAIYGKRTDASNGYLRFDTRQSGTTQEAMRLDASGNMGLGVTPSTWSGRTALEIEGASTGYVTSPNGPIAIGSNIYYNGGDKFVGNGYAPLYALSSGNHIWYTSNNNTSGAGAAVTLTQAMTLLSTGNLGIGSVSPSTKLHVSGASSASALRLDETTSSANSYLGYIDTSGNFGIDVNGGGYLRFAVGGAERARIDSSGNVGIGTSSPSRLLHLSSTGGTFARFTSENTDDFSVGANANGFVVYNETDADYPFVITNTGNVGIGTTSPSYPLEVEAGTGVSGLMVGGTAGQVELQGDGQVYGYQKLDVTSAGLQIKGYSNGGGAKTEQAKVWLTQAATGSAGGEIRFYTNDGSTVGERARILSSGGITFNGDTSSNNALSDFEIGTWSPTILGSTTNPTVTYNTATGVYTKIGNIVYMAGFIYVTAGNLSGGAGTIQIGNIPYSVAAASLGGYQSLKLGYSRVNGVYIDDSNGQARLQPNSTTHLTVYGTNNSSWGSGIYELSFSGTMKIA